MLQNYTAKYTKITSGYMGQLVEWPEVVTEGKDIDDCRESLRDALQEMMADMSVLAEMDMDEEESDDSERDYMEIIEYVRIGIMLFAEHSFFFAKERKVKAEQIHH